MSNNENDFFPEAGYKIPVTSNYLNKIPEGETTFRILSPAIVGFEYFNNENKPVRSKIPFEETPADLKSGNRINHFWAFIIWNYGAERIQIYEITQKTIQTAIKALIDNSKWGKPFGYDITITRKGTTMNDTEYAIMPNPHTEITPVIKEAFTKTKINLEALYTGDDPFKVEEKAPVKK